MDKKSNKEEKTKHQQLVKKAVMLFFAFDAVAGIAIGSGVFLRRLAVAESERHHCAGEQPFRTLEEWRSPAGREAIQGCERRAQAAFWDFSKN